MNKAKIVHLGIGNVGKALVRQILEADCGLIYCGMFNSKDGIFNKSGLRKFEIKKFSSDLQNISFGEILPFLNKNYIVVDTTASEKTYELLIKALEKGCSVVVSNKKPLCSDIRIFEHLMLKSNGRFYYETTVGAGLPVIATLKNLLDTGDKITKIEGCFSGTLGYIFSELEKGVVFSRAVKKAFELGYTEPDPRDDLSGLDVARKALILARTMGLKIELSEINLTSLYPKEMEVLSVPEFMHAIKKLDRSFSGKTLRYVATIDGKSCRVGFKKVEKNSDLGSLDGPDNMVVFTTRRYANNPIVIKGPGSGTEVTASGVFADILEAKRRMK